MTPAPSAPSGLLPPPAVWTIPPGVSVVDALARGLLEQATDSPFALTDLLILLPNRRACRALRDAFLRASQGQPLLLPRLQTLGGDPGDDSSALLSGGQDNLDLPPAAPPLARQLLLTRMILARAAADPGRPPPSPAQAAALARDLASLLDDVISEGLGFERLAELVPDHYAHHWQITIDFLRILTEHWPQILDSQGWCDGAERRNRLLLDQAERWQRTPPDHPVLVAGLTGSLPAAARLLQVIARLPQGRLVLPGLDRSLDAAALRALDATHPQQDMVRLLAGLDLTPAQVPLWPGCADTPRGWLASEMMRPAATTERWRDLAGRITPAQQQAALTGLRRFDCPTLRAEAGTIALLLRQALETEGRTAALVTPDRQLARRVAVELRRWNITADDSAGLPLRLTMPGMFLTLTAEMVAEAFAPHPTLAALKHPLATGGLAGGQFRLQVRDLDRLVLRGPRPRPGLDGLAAAARAGGQETLAVWLEELAERAAPFVALLAAEAVPLDELIRAHCQFAESLAGTPDQPGPLRLWAGDAGESAVDFILELTESAALLPPVHGADYPALLAELLHGHSSRVTWGGHPRLFIWGTIEARLQQTDLLILGGLNDGIWPARPAADPWMSRPMRQDFGLPLPERRIGTAAHDFAQAFCAPDVVLTRALRQDGTPTVPSRWLLRLEAVLRACGAGGSLPVSPAPWNHWHHQLDQPAAFRPGAPPAPCPPLSARPRRLSATAIETWMRDPYALYARFILRLRALDPVDADPTVAAYGSAVHAALEAFLKRYPRGPLPATAHAELLELGQVSFGTVLDRPGVWAFWWPRFEKIASWVLACEREDRRFIAESHSETTGSLTLSSPAGPFVIQAKADRLDLCHDGSVRLVDYKTGSLPSVREVAAGFAPQLPIEALIAAQGGFAVTGGPRPVSGLSYWRLSGSGAGGESRDLGQGRSPGKEKSVDQLQEEAEEGLLRLISRYDDPHTPYPARPNPDFAPKYSDYTHLARLKEWAAGEG